MNELIATLNTKKENLSTKQKELSLKKNKLQNQYALIQKEYESEHADGLDLADQIADVKSTNEDRDNLLSLRRALLKIKERERNILTDRYIVGVYDTDVDTILTSYGLSENMSEADLLKQFNIEI